MARGLANNHNGARSLADDHGRFCQLMKDQLARYKRTWPESELEQFPLWRWYNSASEFKDQFASDEDRTAYVDSLIAEMAVQDQVRAEVLDSISKEGRHQR